MKCLGSQISFYTTVCTYIVNYKQVPYVCVLGEILTVLGNFRGFSATNGLRVKYLDLNLDFLK
jgi:hypothetical protein